MLLTTQAATAAQAPASDSVETWAVMARAIAGPPLRASILGFATPEQRLRLEKTEVEFVTGPSGTRSVCRYPARLAFSERTDAGYRIVICANQLRTVSFVARETFRFSLTGRVDPGEAAVFADFLAFVASYLHRNRATEMNNYIFPCSIRYFIYLKETGADENRCGTGVEGSDSGFPLWLAERNGLVSQPLVDQLRASPLLSGLGNTELIASAEGFLRAAMVAAILMFAAAHEYGHIANGDLDRNLPADCAKVEVERQADAFAIRFLREQRGMQNLSDLTSAQFPWFLLGILARQLSGDANESEELAMARIRTMVRGLQVDAPGRIAALPPGIIADNLERSSRHPILDAIAEHVDSAAHCD